MKTLVLTAKDPTPDGFTGIIEDENGSYWYKYGDYHREDGPAKEFLDGHKNWILEGKHYTQININDYVVLDYYQGKFGLMWYKLLGKDKVLEYPDIPGLITK